MERDLRLLEEREFDLVVAGGGIFGAATAWDAASRGLSVALIERGDFAGATSANSFKMVHGGIRYLQHGDLYRVRESSRERSALLSIAPHLVTPLPIAIPTYGHGMKGKEILRLGCLLYDLVTLDRNRGIRPPAHRIPPARTLSRAECLELFPGLSRDGLTGAVLFHDAQVYNPPRLALAYLRSADAAGAVAANYVEAEGFLRRGGAVCGCRARDQLSGEALEVRGRVVVNAAGPWAPGLLAARLSVQIRPPLVFSRDACFVVPRRLLPGDTALAVLGRTRDPDAILSRPARHLFIVPWRNYSLVGVWHAVHRGDPEEITVTPEELGQFLAETNDAYPGLGLTLEDVSLWNAGLVLFGDNRPGARDLSYGKRSRLVDHQAEDSIAGLVSLVGVRYTTARGMAARAVDLVFRKLGRRPPPSRTAVTPLWGGAAGALDALVRRVLHRLPALGSGTAEALARNHGTAVDEVLRYVEEEPELGQPVSGAAVLRAEVVHAVREEMAVKLADVVLRRTELGTGAHPGDAALRECAELMARELSWSASRLAEEFEALEALYPRPQPA